MRPWPLRLSLTLLFTGVLAALTTVLALAFHSILVTTLHDEARKELDARAQRLLGYLKIEEGRPVLEFDRTDPEEASFVSEATLYYQLYRARDGFLVEQSDGLESLGMRLTSNEVAEAARTPGAQDIETEEGRLRLLTTPVRLSDGELYVAQIGEKLARTDRTLEAFDRILIWRISAGLLGAAVIGMWLAGRGLSPLLGLAAATRNIDVRNLQARLPLRGTGDELDQVAEAFNHALDRVEHSVGEMRQFSAALAHELRTPLAILRGQAEVALRTAGADSALAQTLASQIEEFDRLTALINQLLTLARAEAGEIRLLREMVDLAALTTAVVDDVEPVAAARTVNLTSQVTPAVVSGDPGWLRRLMLILVDNAIKYTPEGGAVHVEVSRTNGDVRLAVRDSGVGIPAEAVPHLFERFYRVEHDGAHDVRGAGLGLALARWIADCHAGRIDVESQPGAGSAFTLVMPAAPGEHLTPSHVNES